MDIYTTVMLQNIVKEQLDEARELRGLFEKQLKELYWAEDVMVGLISETIRDCSSKDLVVALEHHKKETAGHIIRLQRIFSLIGIHASTLPYEGIKCLIDEIKDAVNTVRYGVVRDAAIICILQKVKHYEIACYGTMRAYAIALREEDVVTLLEYTLNEEKEADLTLSLIAQSHINIEAADKEI